MNTPESSTARPAPSKCPDCGKRGLGRPTALPPVQGLPTPTMRRCRYCNGVFDTTDLGAQRKDAA